MSATPRPFTILAPGTSVAGPSAGGSTDNAIARWDGTTGRLLQNSAVTVADTTGAMTFSNTGSFISIAGTAASTSTSTGALVVSGGVGVAGAVYIGGNAAVGGTIARSNFTVSGADNLISATSGNIYVRTTDATAADKGGSIILGGAVTGDNIPFVYLGGKKLNSTGTNYEGYFTVGISDGGGTIAEMLRLSGGSVSAGSAIVRYTTASTSTTTGSLINAGGFGNAGAAWIGGLLNVAGNLTVSGTTSAIGNTISASTNLILSAGTTAISSLRIPHGSAPTSPVDGDMWTTTAGLYVRINGGTVGPLT